MNSNRNHEDAKKSISLQLRLVAAVLTDDHVTSKRLATAILTDSS